MKNLAAKNSDILEKKKNNYDKNDKQNYFGRLQLKALVF